MEENILQPDPHVLTLPIKALVAVGEKEPLYNRT
jgi:hypothetical protein